MISKETEKTPWTPMLAFHYKIFINNVYRLRLVTWANNDLTREFKTEKEPGNLTMVNMTPVSVAVWMEYSSNIQCYKHWKQ